jgi:drug/metabolite transporter (DMT)-like permease
MLGGMLLPLAYGILFRNEAVTPTKIICVVLIAIATAMSFEKGKKNKGNMKYYLAVFVLNGTVGVISTIHQTKPELAVDSFSFMATVNVCVVVACAVYHLIVNKKLPVLKPKELGCAASYAVCNGIGNLFCLITLTALPASVQFPLVSGGVIALSAATSVGVFREKIGKKEWISVAGAVLSTVLYAF